MTKCRLCQHSNPPGAERCEECGTWLSQNADPAASVEQGSTGAQTPDASSPTPASAFESEVLALLKSGQKIAAIKLYREKNGTDLKTAKEAVEALAERHGMPRGGGCAGAVLILLLAGLVIIYLA